MGAAKQLDGHSVAVHSVSFRDNVRVPGTTALSKRVTQGQGNPFAVGTVDELVADYGLRIIFVRNMGKAVEVPFENVAEIIR